MYRSKIVLFCVMTAALLLLGSIPGWSALFQDDIGACLAQRDGSRITLSCEEILWLGKSGKSFAIKEFGEPQPALGHARLTVVSTQPLPVSKYWSCDLTGVLSTFSGVSKNGAEISQRVLIVSPEDVTVYCDSKGRPFLFPPFKGYGMDWPNKRTLAELSGRNVVATASVSIMDAGSFPSMPDSLDSASEPVYCATIADAKAQYSAVERNLVELQCRPFSGATSTQFTLGQDSPADSITVYYTGSSSLSGRINKVLGTIQKDASNNYWIEVDSGPNWQSGDFTGSVQSISSGTIAWSRTFADLSTLPSPLSGKVVTRAFPSLGYFYIEETDRSSGIRVYDTANASNVMIGDIVDVAGDMSTDDGERVIVASSTTITGSTTVNPLGVNNRALAGGDINVLSPGAYAASGLNNVGLLIRTWGKVTNVGSGYFYFDDGSGCQDGTEANSTPVNGVRVVNVSGYMPSVGDVVAVTGISGLATYVGNYARTIRLAEPSDLLGISPALPPSDLSAVATGSGKITLYWHAVPGASGYNVYRGTTSGGEVYTTPVNGSTPVTTLSYSGGNVYTYSDTGLTNGVEYFYTVKSISGSTESQPSNEDSDVPDASAIPWDSTSPSGVLSAFRSVFAGNFAPIGSLRVVGPDGQIYEDGQSNVLPPDGAWVADTNQFRRTDDGTLVTLPSDDGALDDGQRVSIMSAWDPKTLKQHKGPYRRVRTSESYRGVKGRIYVPTSGYVHIRQDLQDFAYIYLGSSSGLDSSSGNYSREVDAGIQWSPVTNSWAAFMLMNGRIVSSDPNVKKRIPPVVNLPASSPRFQADQYIDMSYDTKSPYASGKKKIALLKLEGINDGLRRSLGAYTLHTGNANVCVKRSHSIAGPHFGVQRTGSYIRNVEWSSGSLITSTGGSATWSKTVTIENGSNPAKGSIVNWFESAAFSAETNIKIELPSQ